jgi:hypothetical protein
LKIIEKNLNINEAVVAAAASPTTENNDIQHKFK